MFTHIYVFGLIWLIYNLSIKFLAITKFPLFALINMNFSKDLFTKTTHIIV